MTDMGQLPVAGDDLRDRIEALVDVLLVDWLFGEGTGKEGIDIIQEVDEEEEEGTGNEQETQHARINRERAGVANLPRPQGIAYHSRLPLPSTGSGHWRAKGKDRQL